MPQAAPSRTAHSVVRRIDALRLQAAEIELRCSQDRLKTELHDATAVLEEARGWLRASTTADPVLVTHVARMVSGACDRLYAVSQQIR